MKKDITQDEVLHTLLAGMVGTVDPHSIFYAKVIERGQNAGKYGCSVGGKRINPIQVKNLQDEVKMLEQMQLWKIFTETLKHEAEMRMFTHAKTTEDMFWGKAILHSISIFKSINTSIRNAEMELSTPTPPG